MTELRKVRIQGVSELSGSVEDISSFRKSIYISHALVHTKNICPFVHRHSTTTTTPSGTIPFDSVSIPVISAAGIATGSHIILDMGEKSGEQLYKITNVVGNILYLDRPICRTINETNLITLVDINLATNGSLSSPIIYTLEPPTNAIWQITKLTVSFLSVDPMDDGKFGSLGSLTNGLIIRKITGPDSRQCLAIWRNNSMIQMDTGNFNYAEKAKAGFYGANSVWNFRDMEITCELDGSKEEIIEVLVQDNLIGLEMLRIKVHGRVSGE